MTNEVDRIYMLLIFSLVYNDWQKESVFWKDRRGYNIGALLVNENYEPEYYSLNTVISANNVTQHAELRSILGFLEKSKKFNLSGYTMFSTLEPCIMCAGMMTMSGIKKIVFGQRDVKYNYAFERINRNIEIGGETNFYPLMVETSAYSDEYVKQLNILYREFLGRDQEKVLAKFLASEETRVIYEKACSEFLHFKAQSSQEKITYKLAIEFYEKEKNRLSYS
jgi:tRNA(Arg) A34 adenosine deaminase TadA